MLKKKKKAFVQFIHPDHVHFRALTPDIDMNNPKSKPKLDLKYKGVRHCARVTGPGFVLTFPERKSKNITIFSPSFKWFYFLSQSESEILYWSPRGNCLCYSCSHSKSQKYAEKYFFFLKTIYKQEQHKQNKNTVNVHSTGIYPYIQ